MRSLLATMAVVLLATGCSGPGLTGPDRRLAEGEVVTALGLPGGRAVTVVTPAGRMLFVVGTAGEETPYERDPAQTIGAPEGGELVGVGFDLAIGTAPSSMRPAPGSDPVLPQVSLVAGGETYPLDVFEEDLPVGADLWVGVASAEALGIEVEFDGLVQRVDVDTPRLDDGVAARLYTDAEGLAPATVPCGSATVEGEPVVLRTGACRAEVARVPWLASTGWVESRDQAWLVVRPQVSIGSFELGRGADRVVCGPFETTGVTYLLDGEEPVSATPTPGEDGAGSGEVVFEIDRAEGPVDLVVTAVAADGAAGAGCPQRPELTWRTTLY